MEKLEWSKIDVDFADANNRKMLTAKVNKDISMEDLKDQYQKLSTDIKNNSKNGKALQIGCARHYKHINKWVAGTFTKIGDPVILLNVSYNNAFDDDEIDGYEYYIIVDGDDTYFNKPHYHPKRNQLGNQKAIIDKSIFDKPKKAKK